MRGRRASAHSLAALLLLVGVGLAACAGGAGSPGEGRARGASSSVAHAGPGVVRSNVLFADYAGTAACARCHSDYVKRWLASPMHNMTRDVRGARVVGPFDGTTFSFKDDTAKLETIGTDRYVTVTSKRLGSGVFRVTRVIGGRHREDYAGVPVDGARVGAAVLGDPTEEHVLPVSFVYGTRSLRYKGYSVMVKERPGLHAGPVWNQTCIFCHNTVPYLDTVLGALAGRGAPAYQGEVVDPLLPSPLRATYAITDSGALTSALEQELSRIGAPAKSPTLRSAIDGVRRNFRARDLVEVGIGCESCHLGAAEHVRNPTLLPSLEPRSAAFEVRSPNGVTPRAARVNRACARCHQVLFSGYEPTWEGGKRHGTPGGSNINSGEARDMMLGNCATKASCVDCHDPHSPSGAADLQALDPAKQDRMCTQCHGALASPDALRAHSHHDVTREGARCISCHMPKKNLSLDGSLSRYHRIGVPTDPERVLLDRPLECALCHADKSVTELVTTMERWWNKRYDRPGLEKSYGALDANVLRATAERGKPHEQAVAFERLGSVRDVSSLPIVASQLTHPLPLVRGYAKRSLDAIEGAPVPIDIDRDPPEIEAATRAWLARRRTQP